MTADRPAWLTDAVLAALASLADRADKHGETCPRCLEGRINRTRTKHGFCQRCEDEITDKARASKRDYRARNQDQENERARQWRQAQRNREDADTA